MEVLNFGSNYTGYLEDCVAASECQLNEVLKRVDRPIGPDGMLKLPLIAGATGLTAGPSGTTGCMFFDTLSETVKVYYNGMWNSLETQV